VNVGSFRQALCELADILAASGAENKSQSLRAVAKLLEGHDEEAVEAYLASLRQQLSESKPRRAQSSEVNAVAVAHYVRRLQDAGSEKAEFDAILAELRNDETVRKAEADAIAHGYTAGRRQWPTKHEALAAIETCFGARAFDATKMRRV
jgi:hypothetical protein